MSSGGWGTTRFKQSPIDRFWKYVNRRGPNECWEWVGSRASNGYGQLGSKKGEQPHKAHRLSYEMHHGRIPEGMVVMHSCDNPPCVNPDHLRVGTQGENMRDAARKGRMPHGESSHTAVLTESAVRDARARYAAGESAAAIAERYGVTGSTIYMAVTGETWAHVDGAVALRPNAKISAADAEVIRARRLAGEQLKPIAADYGITISQVCRIAKGNRRAA